MMAELINTEKKIALLIDADNISTKYADSIFDELNKYGDIVIRRVYGDWTKQTIASWMEVCQKYAMIPVMQENNVSGKNASDICLVIDTMKLLFSNKADIFCIISSDSDFTLLAKEIRENGIPVIGMGEEKTPIAFINACRKFVVLNSLLDDNILDANENPKLDISNTDLIENKSNITDINIIKTTIMDIIVENKNKGKNTHLGEIGSRLQKKYPEFDVRNYGFVQLTPFVKSIDGINVNSDGRNIYVSVQETIDDILSKSVYKLLSKNKAKNIGQLKKELIQCVSINIDTKIKAEGFSKFSTYLKHLDGVVVIDNNTVKLV